MLIISVLIVKVWRDRGVARRLVAVRDNETAASAMGIPIVRTKLLAFALSGFLAGYAGVALAFATERFSTATFDPAVSILVISMVVIGGLGSISGAVLGAVYLLGLPAIFGATSTVLFLTSGFGLLAFILYLPGGLAEILHRIGDLATEGIVRIRTGRAPERATRTRHRPLRPRRARRGGRLVSPRTRAAGPARLEIEDLVVSFGGVRAVDHVSLTAEPGSIVGLIGPNGSGKTTVLDAISGFVTPRGGSIRVDGEDLGDYLPEERISISTVRSFQDCQLFPELSVEDTLLLSQDARNAVGVLSTTLQMPWARRSERAKRHAVDAVIASFGLERFRDHRTAQLSTGTRRVVDLASIVLAEPRLLLLDEPTAGIAQREAEAFIPLLRRLHEVADTTIVLVEHDVPLVFELCSNVVVMEVGRVVATGTPDEVSRDPRGTGRLPRRERGRAAGVGSDAAAARVRAESAQSGDDGEGRGGTQS